MRLVSPVTRASTSRKWGQGHAKTARRVPTKIWLDLVHVHHVHPVQLLLAGAINSQIVFVKPDILVLMGVCVLRALRGRTRARWVLLFAWLATGATHQHLEVPTRKIVP